MSYFGVTSSIGLCSSHIYSNPITIAAIERQRAKERGEVIPPKPLALPMDASTELRSLRRQLAEYRALEIERNWHDEFQANIKRLKLEHDIYGDRVTVEQIIREGVIGTKFGIKDIKGPRRTRELVKLRQTLMARAYVECNPVRSLPELGRLFGGRDHTTVLHAVQKMGVHQPGGRGYPGARGKQAA